MKQLIIFVTLLCLVIAQEEDVGSEECKAGKDEMFMAKNFVEGFMKSCLNVTCPEELKQIAKNCFRKTIMNTTFIKDITQGIFPGKPAIAEFLKNLELCKLRDSGLQSPETNIDAEGLIRAAKLDQWTGDKQEINMIRDKIRECLSKATGATTVQKLVSHHKCMVNSLIDYCTAQGEDPGMMLVISSKLLTINDDSKCASVKVPQEAVSTRKQCMEQAKRNMNSTMPSDIEKTKNPMKKLKLVVKYFMKEYLMKAMECCAEKKGFYDNTTKTFKMEKFAEYVKGLDGWNNIMQERDNVYNAIIECGKEFNGVKQSDDSSSEEDVEDIRMKEMMMGKIHYEKCFSPKFAKICGINNELSNFLYPLLDPEFMGDIFKAFMDIGGKEAMNIIDSLKQKI